MRSFAPQQNPAPSRESFHFASRRKTAGLSPETRPAPKSAGQAATPPIVTRALASPGQPLDPATRDFMERRLGHDFSQVRVHTDETAANAARQLRASAYTVGRDIAFGAGRFKPHSGEGRRRVAHELAHVVQQSRGGPVPPLDPAAPHEKAADQVAGAVAAGKESVTVLGATGLGVARSPEGDDGPSLGDPAEEPHFSLDVLLFEVADALTGGRASKALAPRLVGGLMGTLASQQQPVFIAQDEKTHKTKAIIRRYELTKERQKAIQVNAAIFAAFLPYAFLAGFLRAVVPDPRAIAHMVRHPGEAWEGLKQQKREHGWNAFNPVYRMLVGLYDANQDMQQAVADGDLIYAVRGGESLGNAVNSAALVVAAPTALINGVKAAGRLANLVRESVRRIARHGGAGGQRLARMITEVLDDVPATHGAGTSDVPPVHATTAPQTTPTPAGSHAPLKGATDAEIDAALESMSSPQVTGPRSRPRIEGHAVPTTQRPRLDVENIPRLPGETLPQALTRVRRVIGRKLSEIPAVSAAWARARARVLRTNTLTAANYEQLYNATRSQFWNEVRGDADAMRYFTDAGFVFPPGPTTAPLLGGVGAGGAITDIRVSLDHLAEKAIGNNWTKALDADNLQMEFAKPNTNREIIQARHPELRQP